MGATIGDEKGDDDGALSDATKARLLAMRDDRRRHIVDEQEEADAARKAREAAETEEAVPARYCPRPVSCVNLPDKPLRR